MIRSTSELRSDAIQIWRAGLAAVGSERLIREQVQVDGPWLAICAESGAEPIDLRRVRRIAVVGAGKAGAGMAAALEEVLTPPIRNEKQLVGWVNVPADCVRPLERIQLHPARPAGVNEPTAEGIAGSMVILRIVESLSCDDLCLCLISGGGSALLPAPPDEITLADKLAVTRHLSAAGADITQLNTVRKQLSLIKGGGLLRACRAGRMIGLIISDVLGDPLDLIASGPTVADSSTPAEAMAILLQFDPGQTAIPAAVYGYLYHKCLRYKSPSDPSPAPTRLRSENYILANNATAVDAAGIEAVRLGYAHAMIAATRPEGEVDPIGRHLADMGVAMRDSPGPDCLISGGEGVVRLVEASRRGLGGRNQQMALAALVRLAEHDSNAASHDIAIVSAGTDGEDGPTDAAGAIVDSDTFARARQAGLDAEDYLQRNDSHRFFDPVGGLLKTGPTHTNVGDLRVVTVSR